MISIIRYTEQSGISTLQLEELKSWDPESKTEMIWVDIYKENENDSSDILDKIFKFHPLAIEDSIKYLIDHQVHLPKVDDYDDYIFVIFNGLCSTKNINYEIYPLSCFVGHNYLVTVHRNKEVHDIFQKLNDEYKTNVFKRGTDYVLHLILDDIVDNYYPILDSIEKYIDEIETNLFKQLPTNRTLVQILRLKREIIKIRRIASYQKEILFRLSRGEFDEISKDEAVFYRNVYDHLIRITDTIETYRDLVTGLMDSYLSIVNNKMNEVIKFLTIVSTISLPIIAVTGFYGMNFSKNMPFLESEYGVYLSISIMTIFIILMVIYFVRRGWITKKDL